MPEPVPDTSTPDAEKTAAPTVLEQLGGVSGLVYSTLPVVVFVPFNSYFGLSVALWAALGVAAAVLVWRLVRRSPLQPAISGFFGVGICAFIAYRTGDAKGYFLFGIYTSLVYGGAFVLSVLARWPLVGVIWGYLNGKGTSWRRERSAVRYYDVATIAWASVFAARYIVQSQLYDSDQTGWLAVARIGMGWPLTGVALLVTLWAVRQADRALDLASNDEQADELPSGQTDRST
ncbi:hypothetical protein CH252_23000 [Rhodococcus sp. 06-1477-1B]|uniref:DUF3159 domain-containing protein n=1 Tax=Rhodococcus sp. 06-1474-1B TaxID=2022499 RepID=UPI000B9C23E5|nr:DUF3159 domain-containing protein [Rhodococcus sp. 06-1474-1B]OZD44831.1 hypothetical protein CH252_23000 [Rhodococcus sp. 06-1477-1B]OZD50946.1 hypothetical protein CH266_12415 [Rhodococcus sp. 06-1474-1B]